MYYPACDSYTVLYVQGRCDNNTRIVPSYASRGEERGGFSFLVGMKAGGRPGMNSAGFGTAQGGSFSIPRVCLLLGVSLFISPSLVCMFLSDIHITLECGGAS